MNIFAVTENKKQYLDLLFLADEDERMIDKYLERGEMLALRVGEEVVAVAVVTDEGEGVLEIKNLATAPAYQGKGYGRRMIEHIAASYADRFHTLEVGTGDSPLTVPFYERCGFARSRVIPNFFTDNYDHPIVEAGVTLRDMVILSRKL